MSIEEWMVKAGRDIFGPGLSGSFVDHHEKLLSEGKSIAEANDGASEWIAHQIASLIAKHTPKPEPRPIRRGDVVQVIYGDCSVIGVVVREPTQEWITVQSHGKFATHEAPPNLCVRIGRARYYPDGTEVEG